MPDLDDLLDADARVWRTDIDRRMRAFVEPAPKHRVRTTIWSTVAAAALTVLVFVIVFEINHPAREGGGVGQTHHAANASCVAPQLVVTPGVVARGGSVAVHGEWFADGCNDTGGSAVVPPMHDVAVYLIDGSVRQLGTAQPSGDRYAFVLTVQIPDDARTGAALITYTTTAPAQPSDGQRITITR